MALLELFIASSMPVIKLLLITAVGSFLALDHINILGDEARKHLNKIVFYVFNPALVASNLAKALDHGSMKMMWFMALNVLTTFVIGSILGVIIIYVTRTPRHLRGLILGCCAAGNMGHMLLIIIPTICKEKGVPFAASGECQTYGMAYASLSMAFGAIFLWSYVYNMVRLCASNNPNEEQINSSVRNSSVGDPNCKMPLLPPKEHGIRINNLETLAPTSNASTHLVSSESTTMDKLKRMACKVSENVNLKALFAPSTIGAIIGFVVGLTPVIQKLLIGQVAPLHVIEDAALLVGDGTIPSVTLVMGGNLLKGLRRSEMPKKLVVGVIIARYIVLPMIGTAVVKGAIHFGMIPDDPLYQFILLLQYAVPPAMNIATITQMFGAGSNECSVILLWAYILASVALTLWSTYFMWLVT